MNAPVFSDKNHRPTDKEILAAVGRAAGAWRLLFEELRANHPPLTEEWRYYADGKSWLLKVSSKKKTVFWLIVDKNSFRVSFYFPERVKDTLLASGLSERCKAEIRTGEPMGKLRAVRLRFGPQRGVRDVMALIALKETIK